MYKRALAGYKNAVGPDHPRSQSLQEKLSALDADIKNKALAAVEESETSLHLFGKKTTKIKTLQVILKAWLAIKH